MNDTVEPINPPVIPEADALAEAIRDLPRGDVRQIPDILDCVSDSGSCWKHASGMTGGTISCSE